MKILIAKLSDTLQEMGVSSDVVYFVENAPNQLKPWYINTLKKNPNISIQELQEIQPKQKSDPYLQNEKSFVRFNIPDELENLKKWTLANFRKFRRGLPPEHPNFPKAEYQNFFTSLKENIHLIIDWVRAENPNLSNMTITDIMFAQNVWHQKIATEGMGKEYEPTKPENIIYGPKWKNKNYNGWTIQNISSENDLEVEGNKMNHCVASYWYQVFNFECKIYSLRDPSNNPHVTIETDIDTTDFRQIMGKSNSEPKDEYKAMIKEWVQSLDGECYISESTEDTPVEKFYDAYSGVDEMVEMLDEILTKKNDDYGLIDINEQDIDIEDMIQSLIQKREKDARGYRDYDYSGAITDADNSFLNLARRIGEKKYKDPIKGLYELEKVLYQIEDQFNEDFDNTWDWEYHWEDPPNEENFKTQDEFNKAMEEYEEAKQEAEEAEISEHRGNYTRYALPDNILKMLHEMRHAGHYPQWEELERKYNVQHAGFSEKAAYTTSNWYKTARIYEYFKLI